MLAKAASVSQRSYLRASRHPRNKDLERLNTKQTAAKGCTSCTVITEAIVALVTPSLPKDTKIVLGVFIKAYPGDQPSFFLVSFDSKNPVREKYSDHIELYSSPGQTVLLSRGRPGFTSIRGQSFPQARSHQSQLSSDFVRECAPVSLYDNNGLDE